MRSTLLSALVVSLSAFAAQADDDHHDHQDLSPRHRPKGVPLEAHHHAHPAVGLSHPIISESPLPETHLRMDYSFADGGDGSEHAIGIAGEYAFTPNMSLEVELPYAFVNPDGDASTDRIGDAALSLKLATFALIEHRILPAVGLEVILPTGNEERGIGNDHVVELEPFVRVGYWAGKFELIGGLSLGIPLNQKGDENDEEKLAIGYNVSVLYHVARDVQCLCEIHGETVFGDSTESILAVSPGVMFQPFTDKSISLGVGATLPITDDRDFDYAVNLMTIIHF